MASLVVDELTIELDPNRQRRMEPLRAWSAMQKLLADKEDTKQAFEIVRALSGRSTEKDFARFIRSNAGLDIYAQKRELIPVLSDYEWLGSLTEGSFGRAYLEFVQRENISAVGLEEEGTKARGNEEELKDDLAWYSRRVRDTHDLMHVVTGYGRDGLGEACLLAFSYSQSQNIGLIFMAFMAGRSMKNWTGDKRFLEAVWEGKKNGRVAEHIASSDLEHLLTQPLEAVRAQLNIKQATLYQTILPIYRSYEAQGEDIVANGAQAA